MTNDQLKEFIISIEPEAEFEEGPRFLQATISSEKLHHLAQNLKDNPSTAFDYLFCLTGVDWLEFMMVVYHLKSTTHNHNLVLKGKIENREKPEIDTVSDLWQTAEFHEREAYDFYGIVFKNHPDLRRILLPDDWVGYPMRKDYEDPINIIDY